MTFISQEKRTKDLTPVGFYSVCSYPSIIWSLQIPEISTQNESLKEFRPVAKCLQNVKRKRQLTNLNPL